jgi:hypothetical protein
MSPEVREEAVRLLLVAPPDSGLQELLAEDWRPLGARHRELFAKASTWPDRVRDEALPERKERYDHPRWHYINYFWESAGEAGAPPRERPDLKPAAENVVERLDKLVGGFAGASRSDAQRAVDLAWILHLVGDIHQPLHTSGRVTATEPKGDRGGNFFELAGNGADNLHAYWDRALRRERRRRRWESEGRYLRRLSESLMDLHPPESFAGLVGPADFETWARQSYRVAAERAYPPDLQRKRKPPPSYRETVRHTSEAAVALAGYRLAALLEEILGGGSPGRDGG